VLALKGGKGLLQALLVFMGGGLGALARWGFGLATARLFSNAWPWGTFGVNVLGGFVMGLVIGHMIAPGTSSSQNENLRLFLATGFLGGFTTFSAFSLETARLIEAGRWVDGGIYVLASVTLCVAAVFAGMALARANG
jgi:fluoride exporter